MSKFTRKDLEEMAKRMKAAANVPKESLKLKAPAQSPFDDKETTSGMVFTRKRKTLAAPTEHSYSIGRAPSIHVVPFGGQIPPRDTMVIQEGEAESSKKSYLWDPNLDASFYLEEALLPNEKKKQLMAMMKVT